MNSDSYPEPFATVRVFLADSRRQWAVWTGSVWWSRGDEIPAASVQGWEPLGWPGLGRCEGGGAYVALDHRE